MSGGRGVSNRGALEVEVEAEAEFEFKAGLVTARDRAGTRGARGSRARRGWFGVGAVRLTFRIGPSPLRPITLRSSPWPARIRLFREPAPTATP